MLEPLLADESITEIMVNGPDEVYVERDGRTCSASTPRFTGEAELMQTIDRIVSTVNRRVDESSPMVDARLPTGERVNVIIPPLSLRRPDADASAASRALFTLRRSSSAWARSTADTADLLRALVRARMSTSSSPAAPARARRRCSTRCRASSRPSERIVTIEDSAELQLQQPHVISLEARPPNVEGKGQVTIRDLVRNSLRMRPDRIIVGEVRGAETLDMLQAHEHRPRRLADHGARQLGRGRDPCACRRWPR